MNNAEKHCQWHFAKSLGGQDQGPNEAMSEHFKKLPYASLVRESLQNSLDAMQKKTGTVYVSFDFKQAVTSDYPQLFLLRDHIIACLAKYNDQKARDKFQPMIQYINECTLSDTFDYLEVNDSFTTGMDYRKDDARSGFYSFVKCAGNSAKNSTSSGGSFGFGKAAYFNVSKLRTVFVSTQTVQGKCFFEGVSSLCTHVIAGEKRVPVGFYTDRNDEEPIENPQSIPGIFRRESAGTTISIIGLDYHETSKLEIKSEIIKSVLLDFWLAILDEKLVVKVAGTEIKASNLLQTIVNHFGQDLADAKRVNKTPFPYALAVFGARSGNKTGMAANCKYFEDTLTTLGKVQLYMFVHKEGVDKIQFMRTPRMLVQAVSNGTSYGFSAVFICDDPLGNVTLQRCENAAHNEWDYKNFEADRQGARMAMNELSAFVQKCIQHEFASDSQEVLTIGGVEDYLYIPASLDEETNTQGEKQHEIGTYTGNVLEQGTVPTTTGSQAPKIQPVPVEPKPQIGKVTIVNSGPTKPDSQGKVLTGNTTKPRTQPGGGGQTAKNPKNPVTPQSDGNNGNYAVPIQVGYRAYVQKASDGSYEHHIVIHTLEEAQDTQITILTGGDSGEAPESLKSADSYEVVDNTILGVPLAVGVKNHVVVKFEDDMPHAIRLDVIKLK